MSKIEGWASVSFGRDLRAKAKDENAGMLALRVDRADGTSHMAACVLSPADEKLVEDLIFRLSTRTKADIR